MNENGFGRGIEKLTGSEFDADSLIIKEVFALLFQDAKFYEAKKLVHPLVFLYMDGVRVFGRGVWLIFFKILKNVAFKKKIVMKNLKFRPTTHGRIIAESDLVTGQEVYKFKAVFRVTNGQITAIYSKKSNYQAFFGEECSRWISFLTIIRYLKI